MARTPAVPDPQSLREEARVHLGALHDLGPEYEDEVVASFVQKIEKALDARIEAKLNQRRLPQSSRSRVNPVAVLATAMALGIPLTAVAGGIGAMAGGFGAIAGILAVWAGIIFLVLYFDLRR